MEQDLAAALPMVRVREPMHLYLFSSKPIYQQYLQQYFPDVPYRRALFVKERGPGMVFAHVNSEFDVDVRHECTHAVLHASLPMVPLWLDEGLAEYFESPREQRASGNPHLAALRWRLRLTGAPSMEELEAKRDLSEMGRSDYRHSWAWAHFMLHGPPAAREELIRFLADIQANTPPGQLSQRLKRRMPDLEEQFVEHFRTWE